MAMAACVPGVGFGAALAAPDLYAKDPARFAKLTEALGKAQADLAKGEEEWLELEILREEIEG